MLKEIEKFTLDIKMEHSGNETTRTRTFLES